MISRRFSLLISIVAVGGLLAGCSSGSSSDSNSWPNTEVIEVSSNTATSTDAIMGDKVTIVNLWALWCAPCREELPRLQDVSTAHADTLDVVGVNIGDDFGKTSAYIEEAGLTIPMYWDETGELLTALKIPSVPATLAINKNGEIVWFHLGALTAAELTAKVNELTTS